MMDPRSSREAGYNLVVLIIAIAVMTAMLAAMLPLISQEIRRDKEEELVFRGFQYIEAIRLFQRRYQRLPTKLSELVEVKPRCIRQLWKDPMTDDGKWGLIFQNNDLTPITPQQGQPPGTGQPQPNTNVPQTSDANNPSGLGVPKKGDVVQVGPIIGVYSKSSQKSILVFAGHERYDEWRFTIDILNNMIRSGGAAVGTGQFQLSTRWIGRPWPSGIQGGVLMPGVQNGTLPNQSTGGFKPIPDQRKPLGRP
ncbi:MAG TPA: type II secretion system protein [Thermoanaerobaculia bacterium]|jgi:type II secretory pathway pseudopilin PulG|nr:type II secretion system protein [Thermoanaerobaculia bacterium]